MFLSICYYSILRLLSDLANRKHEVGCRLCGYGPHTPWGHVAQNHCIVLKLPFAILPKSLSLDKTFIELKILKL